MKLPSLVVLAFAATFVGAAEPAPATDLSGRTDASIRAVLRVVARHQLRALKDGDYTPPKTPAAAIAARAPEGIAWNYPWGVTLYGLLRSADATGDRDSVQFVLEHNRIVSKYYAWLTAVRARFPETSSIDQFMANPRTDRIRGLMVLGNLDNCGAMGVEFLETGLRYPDSGTGDENAIDERIADWITQKQDRLPDGTLWRPHARDDHRRWPAGTIWADDLYMACPFLVRWADYTHDGKYLTDAAHQVLNMARRLQDADGLWFHAYNETIHQHSPFKWGRANGWAMVATAEILSAMPENHLDRAALLDVFRRQVEGVKRVQPDSGVWRQVLDHSELWEETSCTAMFAYAIARGVNRGWLPPSDMAVARNAFAGICASDVTPAGVVKGTCEGTGIGLDLAFYVNRRRPDDDYHGRGVVLLAGTEILHPAR